MSNKYSSLTVVLEEELSEESAKRLVDAICLLRNVLSVELGKVDDLAEHIGYTHARNQILEKIYDVFAPNLSKLR